MVNSLYWAIGLEVDADTTIDGQPAKVPPGKYAVVVYGPNGSHFAIDENGEIVAGDPAKLESEILASDLTISDARGALGFARLAMRKIAPN